MIFFRCLLCNDKVLPEVINVYLNDENYDNLIKLLYEFGNSINENNIVTFAKKLLLRREQQRPVIQTFFKYQENFASMLFDTIVNNPELKYSSEKKYNIVLEELKIICGID